MFGKISQWWKKLKYRKLAHVSTTLTDEQRIEQATARIKKGTGSINNKAALPWLITERGCLDAFALPQFMSLFSAAEEDGKAGYFLEHDPEHYLKHVPQNIPAAAAVLFAVAGSTTKISLVTYTPDHLHFYDRGLIYSPLEAILPYGESFAGTSSPNSLLRMLAQDITTEHPHLQGLPLYCYEYTYEWNDLENTGAWSYRRDLSKFLPS